MTPSASSRTTSAPSERVAKAAAEAGPSRACGPTSQTCSEEVSEPAVAAGPLTEREVRKMAVTKIEHPSVEERKARGKASREQAPPSSHAGWKPAADRPDPVALLEEQNATREPDLVPVRHGRMLVSPFTFYRGAAKIMAADLKDTPRAGLDRPALRRRAPVELRHVRVARADAAVRPERLRRDAARSVRVRREAYGRELHDRGAQQRLHQGRDTRRDARIREGLPRGDGRVRADAHHGHLVRAPVRAGADGGASRPWPRSAEGQGAEEGSEEGREGCQEERRRRHARATACRRCPSSRSMSTATTGSSASRRSSSPRAS